MFDVSDAMASGFRSDGAKQLMVIQRTDHGMGRRPPVDLAGLNSASTQVEAETDAVPINGGDSKRGSTGDGSLGEIDMYLHMLVKYSPSTRKFVWMEDGWF